MLHVHVYTSSHSRTTTSRMGNLLLVKCMHSLPVLRPTLSTQVSFALDTTGLVIRRHVGLELRMRTNIVQLRPSSLLLQLHAGRVLPSFVLSGSVAMVNAAVIVVVVAAVGAFISLALHKIEEGTYLYTHIPATRVHVATFRISKALMYLLSFGV